MDYEVTPDWVDEVSTEQLIPAGTYEGTIVSFTTRDVDLSSSPFYGEPMARVQAELYGVQGRNRQHWFNCAFTKKKDANGHLMEPSRLTGMLSKITGKTSVKEILEEAKNYRLKFRLSVSNSKGEFAPRNWTNEIRKV